MSKINLTVTLANTDGNVVKASIGGTITTSDIPELKIWAERVNAAITATHATSEKKVDVIIDISMFETYTDPDTIMVLVELMRKDNPFVRKTATIGGKIEQEMIEQIIKGLANRRNLKNFKTEPEALAWIALA
jgi:hypothetical protein